MRWKAWREAGARRLRSSTSQPRWAGSARPARCCSSCAASSPRRCPGSGRTGRAGRVGRCARGRGGRQGALGLVPQPLEGGLRPVETARDEPGDEEVWVDGQARQGDVEAAGDGDAGQPEGGALVEGRWEHRTGVRGVGEVEVEPGGDAGGQGRIEGGLGGEGWDGQRVGTDGGYCNGRRFGWADVGGCPLVLRSGVAVLPRGGGPDRCFGRGRVWVDAGNAVPIDSVPQNICSCQGTIYSGYRRARGRVDERAKAVWTTKEQRRHEGR